jgi:hypothetical protein
MLTNRLENTEVQLASLIRSAIQQFGVMHGTLIRNALATEYYVIAFIVAAISFAITIGFRALMGMRQLF